MEKPDLILSPTDFVTLTNQVLEAAFGLVRIEGELANYRISRGKWVYFSLKDELSKVDCFTSVYTLPGPLQEGMLVKVVGQPRLHPQFGFSVTVNSLQPSGEGAIKKAYEILRIKLEKEGLFELKRKRSLPYPPKHVALLTSVESAAYTDFIKILSTRWPFCKLKVYDTLVQGDLASKQLVRAVEMVNAEAKLADVLVITRGGGAVDDLAVFSDERVVRAIASSRVPTMVAIGHEIDESLSELVADSRASTPSNAAELLVPDRKSEINLVKAARSFITQSLYHVLDIEHQTINRIGQQVKTSMLNLIENAILDLYSAKKIMNAYNPHNILKRGYAIVRTDNKIINSIKTKIFDDNINIQLQDGYIDAQVFSIRRNK